MTKINITQSVAILCDGNNIERSIHEQTGKTTTMLNFDTLIPKLLKERALNRFIYFREGKNISQKFAERLYENYFGMVVPCHKSADIPLSIKATQLASKVDSIIIMSGDSDYIDLVLHLKSEGVRVEIASVRKNTSGVLIEKADYYHEITKTDWFDYSPQKKVYKRQAPKKAVPKTVQAPKPLPATLKPDVKEAPKPIEKKVEAPVEKEKSKPKRKLFGLLKKKEE